MASKNPFGQLAVRRDDDDEENVSRTNNQQTGGQQVTGTVFVQQGGQDAKKKKKVRPEEKRKIEENQNNLVVAEGDEGFSVVKKKQPGRPKGPQEYQEVDEKMKDVKKPNKGAYEERNRHAPRGKRIFDKQSGTGRGKEIPKGGAGGKYSYGTNPNNIAREAEKHGEENIWDDDCNLIN